MQLRKSQREVLTLFRNSDCPIITAADVSDEYDISRQAARQRLEKLRDRGVVKKKLVGAAAAVYWPVND